MTSFTVQKITGDQVWGWLSKAWRDIAGSGGFSLVYGLVFVALGYAITAGLGRLGISAAIPAAAGAFALLGPLLAVGLYEISRQREAGEGVNVGRAIVVRTASPGQIAFIGFVLLFGLLVWANAARLIFALFMAGDYVPFAEFSAYVLTHPDGLALISVGTVVGGLIAFGIFALTVVSPPLLLEHRASAFEAMGAGLNAVKTNRGPMILWAWIIAVNIAVGFLTLGAWLVIAFPLLGHATWHAYRDLVVATPREVVAEPKVADPADDRPLPLPS